MRRLLLVVALAASGLLGACTPAPKGTHYLSIRNDSSRPLLVEYSGGVRGVSTLLDPGSRTSMRGGAFAASIFESAAAFSTEEQMDIRRRFLGEFASLDTRMLPSGDSVRVYEANGTLTTDGVPPKTKPVQQPNQQPQERVTP